MLYRIDRICDKKFNDKIDEQAMGRIGRIVKFYPKVQMRDFPVYLECVIPGLHKSLILSPLVDFDIVDREEHGVDFDLVIETINSFYYFSKWEGEENDG